VGGKKLEVFPPLFPNGAEESCSGQCQQLHCSCLGYCHWQEEESKGKKEIQKI
jgi:hypothetical protein